MDTNPDPQHLAHRNELTILSWIARFQWLTAHQAGLLVWGEIARHHVAARKTLSRLFQAGEVKRYQLPNGGFAYSLARKGKLRLLESGFSAPQATQRPRLGAYFHRALSNSILIQSRLNGRVIRTEFEVASNRTAIGPEGFKGRIPDGLSWEPEGESTDPEGRAEVAVTWNEIENAPKASNRLVRIRAICQTLVDDRAPFLGKEPKTGAGYYLKDLLFVAASFQPLDRIRTFFLEHPIPIEAQARVHLALVDFSPGLRWGGAIWAESLYEFLSEGSQTGNGLAPAD